MNESTEGGEDRFFFARKRNHYQHTCRLTGFEKLLYQELSPIDSGHWLHAQGNENGPGWELFVCRRDVRKDRSHFKKTRAQRFNLRFREEDA